jgi:hypothetical protein
MDEGSPGLRDKRESGKEKNERDERNGGEKKPGCFLSSIQKFKFFFFLGDVEGATSARDGHWMDAGRTLRITPPNPPTLTVLDLTFVDIAT